MLPGLPSETILGLFLKPQEGGGLVFPFAPSVFARLPCSGACVTLWFSLLVRVGRWQAPTDKSPAFSQEKTGEFRKTQDSCFTFV